MRRKSLLLVIIFVAITLSSCYTMSTGLTEEQAYLAASREFTLSLSKYNDWYDMQSPEVQAKWKEELDPLFLTGNAVLNSWKMKIKAGEVGTMEEQELLRIKSEILHKMYEAGIFGKE